MARGDAPAPSDRPTNLALAGVLGAIALGAVIAVVVAHRSYDAWGANASAAGPWGDPYPGASSAAAQLSWRDTGRLRALLGAPLPPDPRAAAEAMQRELARRGYGRAVDIVGPVTLPADFEVAALERACGLLVIEAEATSRIHAAGRPAGLRTADDPSLVALGACGRGAFRVEGVGSVQARVFLVPGLVEGDVERLSLPEDVLVAHAEAERLLRGASYVPSDEMIRVEAMGSAARTGELVALPWPPSGCTPWAVVVVGAGHLGPTTGSWTGDQASERGLGLAVSCAGDASTHLAVTDDETDGYVAWARPFAARPGPSLPTSEERSLERARVVPPSAIILPASIPASR